MSAADYSAGFTCFVITSAQDGMYGVLGHGFCNGHDIVYTSSTTSIIDQSEDNLQRTPEEEVIDKQRLQLLRAAVAELPDKYRKVIELRYYEDLAYEEISERLGLTLSNVKIQIMRAKQMLSQLMQPMRNAM